MKNFKNILNKTKFLEDKHRLVFGPDPERDWRNIFLSTCIVSLFFVLAGVYIFIKIDKGEIFLVDPGDVSGEALLNTNLLSETVRYYEGKEVKFLEIQNTRPTYPDPSL